MTDPVRKVPLIKCDHLAKFVCFFHTIWLCCWVPPELGRALSSPFPLLAFGHLLPHVPLIFEPWLHRRQMGTLVKKCQFLLSLYLMPPLRAFPSEFYNACRAQETKLMTLPDAKKVWQYVHMDCTVVFDNRVNSEYTGEHKAQFLTGISWGICHMARLQQQCTEKHCSSRL